MEILPSWGRRRSAISSPGQELGPGDDRRLHGVGRDFVIVEDAVDAQPNPQPVSKGFQVDIAGPPRDRCIDQVVDILDDRRLGSRALELVNIRLVDEHDRSLVLLLAQLIMLADKFFELTLADDLDGEG